jgi:hypothetical protein
MVCPKVVHVYVCTYVLCMYVCMYMGRFSVYVCMIAVRRLLHGLAGLGRIYLRSKVQKGKQSDIHANLPYPTYRC